MSNEKDLLGKIQAISSIIAAIAIPLVIAGVGWMLQANIAEQGLQKDYVAMAIKILTDEQNAEDDNLREWAVSVLDKTAPVPFTPELREQLQSGEVKFGGFYFPRPPEQLMEPPRPLIDLPENEPATVGDVFDNALDNRERFQANAIRHRLLQQWIRETEQVVKEGNRKLREIESQ
ncbi:MAG: hypothetical protein COB05_05630 [Marinobacter sp.]|nr:hypothetical protein [Marinobacter sp.]PHS48463.1 MAG: hypothetical protein COB05_05630 [Marinobacter sp.]